MNETVLQKVIIEYLHMHPKVTFCMRVNSGRVFTGKYNIKLAPEGTSDIIGRLYNGLFLALEVKVGKNKPTEAQTQFIDKTNRDGGVGAVVYSVEDVEKILENC